MTLTLTLTLSLVQLCDIRQKVRAYAEDSVKIRYQETTAEDRIILYSIVTGIFGICNSMRLIVTRSYELCAYMWSLNPITNTNPVYSHPNT
jgi:hypothetical protein